MYADTILLFVKDPVVNLNPIIKDIVCFGDYSGLCINWEKYDMFPLMVDTQSHPRAPVDMERGFGKIFGYLG